MACADIDKVFKQMLALERGQLPGGPPAPLDGRRCPYNPEARYIKYRRLLVDWLSELGEDYQLANTTIHAAVEIMDRFLQSMEVHRTRYQLVAMAAFAIAG
jgi:Cyclin, N-terminal domain